MKKGEEKKEDEEKKMKREKIHDIPGFHDLCRGRHGIQTRPRAVSRESEVELTEGEARVARKKQTLSEFVGGTH